MENYHMKKSQKNPFYKKSFHLFNEPKRNNLKLNPLNEKFIIKKINNSDLVSETKHLLDQESTCCLLSKSSLFTDSSATLLNKKPDITLFVQPLSTNSGSSSARSNNQKNDSVSNKFDLNHFKSIQNFYIQKMNDFGFSGFREDSKSGLMHQNDRNSLMIEKSDNNINEEKLFSGISTQSIDSSDSELNFRSFFSPSSINSNYYYTVYNKSNSSFKSSTSNKSNKIIQKAVSKFFSPSLIILPELDEPQMTTNVTGLIKESNSNSLSSKSKNMNRVFTSISRTSRSSQNDLTLPPIVEAQTKNNYIESNHIQTKKNATRVDSGIARDFDKKNTTDWTLSANESEDDIRSSSYRPKSRNKNAVLTSVALVDNSHSLKKNTTSSTFNSYGKSSSNHSRLTSFSAANNKNKSLNIKQKNEPDDEEKIISVRVSEAIYLENLVTISSVTRDSDSENEIISEKNKKKRSENLDNLIYLNKKTSNKNNNKIINNLDRSQSNLSNSKLNISTLDFQSNEYKTQNAVRVKSGIIKRREENQNNNNETYYSNSNSINNTNNNSNNNRKQSMVRQNTVLSSNDLTLSHKNSSIAVNNQTPIPKPRKLEKRSVSMQRQSTFSQSETPRQLSRQETKPKLANNQFTQIIRSNTNDSFQRPKTATRQIQSKTQTLNTNRILQSTNNLIKNPIQSIDTSKILDQANILPVNVNENEENNRVEENLTHENGLNDYTLLRILKWLEDIENCPNMIKPPPQLTWTSSSRTEKPTDHLLNFDNHKEYNLSDYDSVDEQVIEYNRVVDKTFHIVYDE